MGEILRRKESEFGTEVFIASDEPYKKIIYDGLKYPSPLKFHSYSIIATSHSKGVSVPGERIGYLALHPESTMTR